MNKILKLDSIYSLWASDRLGPLTISTRPIYDLLASKMAFYELNCNDFKIQRIKG